MREKINNLLLVNALHASEEVRFALVYQNQLENLYIDKPGCQKKGNIYKARVVRLEPSLQAAFVDYGAERHGFLPFKEITESIYADRLAGKDSNHLTINDVLKENQDILVQVDKEERGTKGAALTTHITLAGSYLVLMPNNPSAGGISRRIEGDERDELRDIIQNLQAPSEVGLIVRTAGVGKLQPELQWDLDILLGLWHAIQQAFKEQQAPCLIHQESDIISRAIRDYLRKDIDNIVIDNIDVFNKSKEYIAQIRPEFSQRVTLYNEPAPLFTYFGVESQIETAFQSHIRLPSGGSLVIQPTEALVSIDVNSAKDTKGGSIEQTAFNTNREAAIEIARQLRLRDLGGLIVVDFIDMMDAEHQREIVQTFQHGVEIDKARVQFGRISKFGLLEISRQRLRPSLSEYTQITCPRCEGLGNIRSVESLSFLILRLITEQALNNHIVEINVQVPNNVAAYLCNEKRRSLDSIETDTRTKIYIIPNPHYELPHYQIDVVRHAQTTITSSYEKIKTPDTDLAFPRVRNTQLDVPAVNILPVQRPADLVKKPVGLIKRFCQFLFPEATETRSPIASNDQKNDLSKNKHQRSRSKQPVKRRNREQREHTTSHRTMGSQTKRSSPKPVSNAEQPITTVKAKDKDVQPEKIRETLPIKATANIQKTMKTVPDEPVADVVPKKKMASAVKTLDYAIKIDAGHGATETIIFNPMKDDKTIKLVPTMDANPEDISNALEKRRKQKTKEYTKKQNEQRRRRPKTTQPLTSCAETKQAVEQENLS